MSASDLAIVAALIFAWGTLSARLERFDVTAPILFVDAGVCPVQWHEHLAGPTGGRRPRPDRRRSWRGEPSTDRGHRGPDHLHHPFAPSGCTTPDYLGVVGRCISKNLRSQAVPCLIRGGWCRLVSGIFNLVAGRENREHVRNVQKEFVIT